mmetsp:Transcript_3384/g.11359  ORF Transcript_3384/g.11359 Transcript_3384/m.11359 type:complete len:256 (+) Transcript_3384:745-1512(+)
MSIQWQFIIRHSNPHHAPRVPDVAHAHRTIRVEQRRNRRRSRKTRILTHYLTHFLIHLFKRTRIRRIQRLRLGCFPDQRPRKVPARDLRAILPALPVPIKHPKQQLPTHATPMRRFTTRMHTPTIRIHQLLSLSDDVTILIHVVLLVWITSLLTHHAHAHHALAHDARALALDLAPRRVHDERLRRRHARRIASSPRLRRHRARARRRRRARARARARRFHGEQHHADEHQGEERENERGHAAFARPTLVRGKGC